MVVRNSEKNIGAVMKACFNDEKLFNADFVHEHFLVLPLAHFIQLRCYATIIWNQISIIIYGYKYGRFYYFIYRNLSFFTTLYGYIRSMYYDIFF